MNIKIQKVGLESAAIIALLGRITTKDAFNYLFLNHQSDFETYLNNSFSVANIKAWMQDDNYIFWLAFANDLPVGYAKIRLNYGFEKDHEVNIAQLDKIYIHQDFLSNNIGQNLLDAIENDMKTYGIKRLWLSVLDENIAAIRFYNRNKFNYIKYFNPAIGRQVFTFNVMMKKLG